MDQTSPDRPGRLKRALNDPLRGWLWMAGLLALIAWAATARQGAWPVPILAALLGIGMQQTLVYIRDQAELTLPLRLWEGMFTILWFTGLMGVYSLEDDPFSFMIFAFPGGAVFAALSVSTKKPYDA